MTYRSMTYSAIGKRFLAKSSSSESPSIIQLGTNATSHNHALFAPPADVVCELFGTHLTFIHDGVDRVVATRKTTGYDWAKLGVQATRRAATTLSKHWWDLQVPGAVEYVQGDMILQAIRVDGDLGCLTFTNINATFTCLPRFIARWSKGSGFGSGRFDLRDIGSPTVIARGRYGLA